MKALVLLKSRNIDPEEPIVAISREEGLRRLIETAQEFCPSLEIEKMSKEDLEILLDSLGYAVVLYHPENHHQERSALLDNSGILRKYGATDSEIEALDFV